MRSGTERGTLALAQKTEGKTEPAYAEPAALSLCTRNLPYLHRHTLLDPL